MIKKLAANVKEFKGDAILAPIFVALEVVLDVLIPYVMSIIIDRGIKVGNMQIVWFYGGFLIAAAVLSLCFGYLSGKYAARASAGFARNLRQNIYYRIQSFSFSNIDRFSTSGLITRLTTDVTNVQNAFQMLVRIAVRSPLMLIFSLVMCFTINPLLSVIFVVVVPIVGIALLCIVYKAHPVFERVFKTYDTLNNNVQENLTGIRVVKAYVREEHEKEKFGKVSQNIYANFSKAEKIVAFNSPIMQFAVYLSLLLLSWFGAQLIVSDTMTTGQLTSLFNYATQILMSLMMLSMVLVMVIMARNSGERIVEVLDEESDLTDPATGLTALSDGSVDFENVTFRYNKSAQKDSLACVNLHIESGQTVGIIGGTGSSKSTLVQLIPRLYDATEGVVRVGGHDVREYDMHALRDNVAMVLQKNILFSGTIKDNLRWGNEDATDEQMQAACKLAQADEFIDGFPQKYDTYIEQGGANVSGGQKQRLCIARALLKRPKILILDDSTSAVDMQTDALIRKAFREQLPDTTKFIIAQRIASIQDADKIIVMHDGAVQAVGTHAELLADNAVYREVYQSQQKGGDDNA
ncbi:MAG: ABC transporter ATP-binding protein [Clostridia bacterium]|nr:ABC transporter ATP-binding protein [Clostridia bacterium]